MELIEPEFRWLRTDRRSGSVSSEYPGRSASTRRPIDPVYGTTNPNNLFFCFELFQFINTTLVGYESIPSSPLHPTPSTAHNNNTLLKIQRPDGESPSLDHARRRLGPGDPLLPNRFTISLLSFLLFSSDVFLVWELRGFL